MSLPSTTALARIANNPDCARLVVIARSRMAETEIYERLTGREYPGEYGERGTARRRGKMFEEYVYRTGGARLRAVLTEVLPFLPNPNRLYLRNLEDEIPGGNRLIEVLEARYARTTNILIDSIEGRRHPEIVIQPVLRLPVCNAPDGYLWIAPDFLVIDCSHRCYMPGELKSYMSQQNTLDPARTSHMRLQLAAQVLALRETYRSIDELHRAGRHGIYVWARPNGMTPNLPIIEDVCASLHTIETALRAYVHHMTCIQGLPAADCLDTEPDYLVRRLQSHYQESCILECALADHCRNDVIGTAAELGTAVSEIFGRQTRLDHLFGIIQGMRPNTSTELGREMTRLANELGIRRPE